MPENILTWIVNPPPKRKAALLKVPFWGYFLSFASEVPDGDQLILVIVDSLLTLLRSPWIPRYIVDYWKSLAAILVSVRLQSVSISVCQVCMPSLSMGGSAQFDYTVKLLKKIERWIYKISILRNEKTPLLYDWVKMAFDFFAKPTPMFVASLSKSK